MRSYNVILARMADLSPCVLLLRVKKNLTQKDAGWDRYMIANNNTASNETAALGNTTYGNNSRRLPGGLRSTAREVAYISEVRKKAHKSQVFILS